MRKILALKPRPRYVHYPTCPYFALNCCRLKGTVWWRQRRRSSVVYVARRWRTRRIKTDNRAWPVSDCPAVFVAKPAAETTVRITTYSTAQLDRSRRHCNDNRRLPQNGVLDGRPGVVPWSCCQPLLPRLSYRSPPSMTALLARQLRPDDLGHPPTDCRRPAALDRTINFI